MAVLAGMIGFAPVAAQGGQAAPAAPAGPVKLAFVNTTLILQSIAEGKKELAALEQYVTDRQTKLDAQRNELDQLRRQYDSQFRTLNPDTAAEMQRSITEKDRTLRRAQEDNEMDLTRRRNEVLGRMGDKIQAVIAEYAEKNGYGAVFLQTPSLPYYSSVLDISQEIVKLYDQKNPAVGAAAVPAAPKP